MSKKLFKMISFVLIATFVLASCAPQATPAAAPQPSEPQAATQAPAEQPTQAAAAAQPTTAPAAAQPAPSGERKLTVWHAYAGQTDKETFINWALDGFKQKYPEIQLDVMGMEQSAYKVKINTAMASGTPPDVFYTLPGGFLNAFVKGGQVYALDEALAKDGWGDSFMPSALARVKSGDKTYAVPIDMDAAVFWYNKKLFEKNGWAVPTTYEELMALAEKIKAAGIVPFALGNKDSWPATFWFQYMSLRLKGTGIVDKFVAGDSSATFMPEATAAFQAIQDVAKAKYFPDGFNGMTDAEANMLFLNGKAAMVLNGTWQIGMSADAPKDSFELGYFPFPTLKDGKGTQTDVIAGVAACFAMSNSAKDKDDAILFLKYMTSPEVAAKYVEVRKTLVTTKGAATEENAGPVLFGISKNVMEPAPSMDAFYDTAMAPKETETYYTTIQGVLDGSIKAEDAANKLESAMKDGK
jgi:raffinose/stachyose/melibiose transport system substrate-binding protein